jgi:hypothetical protein
MFIMEECMICFDLTDNKHFIVFLCNHKVCSQCYPKLTHCPLCNIELKELQDDVCYKRVLHCLCILSGTLLGMFLFLIRFNT